MTENLESIGRTWQGFVDFPFFLRYHIARRLGQGWRSLGSVDRFLGEISFMQEQGLQRCGIHTEQRPGPGDQRWINLALSLGQRTGSNRPCESISDVRYQYW